MPTIGPEAGALSIVTLPSISAIPAAEWDALTDGNPFVQHRFLHALEASGSVGPEVGWQVIHLAARDNAGHLVGAAPVYAKAHSQGEYVFDHAWAEAYTRAGGRYYPKLQCAVPFTPATGPRLLARDAEVQAALLDAMGRLADENGLSGAHVTFCPDTEARIGEANGWLHRISTQYHWINRDYADYDAFLAALSSRKRKDLRKERARAQGFGGTIRRLSGDDLRPEHWDAFWQFYLDTGARKWGRPYLTRAFFDHLHQTMAKDIVLVIAEREDRMIAGALNFLGPDAIYGRYWGCIEDHPFLHFELCYHQAIDIAIERGLERVEAGAQGEHKLARGYEPRACHSVHRMTDKGFHDAVAAYLVQERDAVANEQSALADWTPFRRDGKKPSPG